MKCTSFTLIMPLFTLLAVTGASSFARNGTFRSLPPRGKQQRAVCTAEGKCLNMVVTCPTNCPEWKACSVDCSGDCTATCKKHTHKTMASNATHAYKTWCNKTNHESLCVSMAQSDPRKTLKSSPQGLVVILVTAAQAKANATRSFINESLKNETRGEYLGNSTTVLEGCLLAYDLDWVNSSLSVDIEQVNDKERCGDVNDSLRLVVSEVTYDCEWDLPSPRSSTLSQMYDNVESLASLVDSARQILSIIGCGDL